ncbi:MAG TPA: Crp/Fnr family transcriptional regulator [Terriglobales bacterium]|nr:Crp/Fnr family transcriptional regulator [Terriglobales bacterium]
MSFPRDSCQSCTLRAGRAFCDLPRETMRAFDTIKCSSVYPKGSILFVEGRNPRGIYVVCSGKVRLSLCSDEGKNLTVRTAGPGDILGLSATMRDEPYEVTAETLMPCQVVFVPRKDFLRFLRHHQDACLQVIQLLSQYLHSAYDQYRALGKGRARRRPGPLVAAYAAN